MLNELQKLTIQAIVNIFETGDPIGNYGAVTFSKNDVGCLTYGRSQTTLASGGLALLIGEYCSTTGAVQAEALRPYLPRLDARDRTLDLDAQFTSLLRNAGSDPAMHDVEDRYFDRAYWHPAVRAAEALMIESPLGTAVVYDSFIHGAWLRLRDATLAHAGLPIVGSAKEGLPAVASAREGLPAAALAEAGERGWIREYITLRREWLANHPNPLLRRAVYRMDTFGALADSGNWDLTLPLQAHGVTITESHLSARQATASADEIPSPMAMRRPVPG
jgi:chitosanase